MKTITKLSITMFLLIGLTNLSNAAAESPRHLGGCNFTDSMLISGPVGTKIFSLSATPDNKFVKQINDTHFNIVNDCSTGDDIYVTVTIGTDANHASKLVIEDGQIMMNPNVNSAKSLGGYFYSGMDHPFGTYQYTLKFLQQ